MAFYTHIGLNFKPGKNQLLLKKTDLEDTPAVANLYTWASVLFLLDLKTIWRNYFSSLEFTISNYGQQILGRRFILLPRSHMCYTKLGLNPHKFMGQIYMEPKFNTNATLPIQQHTPRTAPLVVFIKLSASPYIDCSSHKVLTLCNATRQHIR